MTILEFKQEGYKRLALKDIKSVHLRPSSKRQMILGTNGSGKTALMAELSANPSSRDEYLPGGYKEITELHNGSVYKSLSDFRGPKNHFSIHKDDVEIYSGHSSIAYASHVKQELGITKDIHAVRVGVKSFTRMKKDERREWLTNLCPEDYTYAIKYYKELAKATRDITGTINRINIRLTQEKDKLISAETEAAIREEILGLREAKSEMMQHWRPLDVTVDQAMGQVDVIDGKLRDLTKALDDSIKVFCNAKGYKDQQGIWDDISDIQSKVTVIDGRIGEIHELISQNQVLLSEAMLSAGKDKDSLTKELADVSRAIVSTRLGILMDGDWMKDPVDALAKYDQIVPELFPIMTELVEDSNLEFTQSKHKINSDKLAEIQKNIEGTERELNKHNVIVQAYDHRANEDHTECPKCDYKWIRGYSEVDHEKVKAARDNIHDTLNDYKIQYNALHELLTTSSYQLQLLNQIGILARSSTILGPIWEGLTKANFIRVNPSSAIEYVKAIRSQIMLSVEVMELQNRSKEIQESLSVLNSSSNLNYQELQDKNRAYEDKLISLQNEQYYWNQSLAALRRAQKAFDFQERYVTQTDDLISKRNEWISKAEVANKHSAINEVMIYLESEISNKEALLSKIDTQHKFIHALESEVEESKSKEKLMKSAMEALSPSKGLIARGLVGFINHFIAQMNAVIEKVWLYPLVILPITASDDDVELDYMFPYLTDGKPAGKDVEDGSGAQGEIFNIAFMLVSMMHLGLEESPVFLDEFSIKMDYAHRKEAMKMVMDLVVSSNFSQVFMISHYENSYGTIDDVDITVLCSENIELPPDLKYNINATIGR